MADIPTPTPVTHLTPSSDVNSLIGKAIAVFDSATGKADAIYGSAIINNANSKESKDNKTNTISSASTTDQYPSAKGVYDHLKDYVSLSEDVLVFKTQ